MLCFCFHPKWVDCNPLPTPALLSECQTPGYRWVRSSATQSLLTLTSEDQLYLGVPRPYALATTWLQIWGSHRNLTFISSTEPLIELRTTLHLGLGFYYEECRKTHIGQSLREPWIQSFQAPCAWSQRASPSGLIAVVTNQEVHRALLSNDFTGI